MKRFSHLSLDQFHDFAASVIKDEDSAKFDVFIEEISGQLVIVNRETGVGDSIDASGIYYQEELKVTT